MEKSSELNKYKYEQKKSEEKMVISALEQEVFNMEKRKLDIRKNGEGDPKYEILFKFLNSVKSIGFNEVYDGLKNFEKHAIVTRLENQARLGNLPFNYVEKFRRELYGVKKDEEGKESINFDKQIEFERVLQDMWQRQEK